jgi:hypothetical protein
MKITKRLLISLLLGLYSSLSGAESLRSILGKISDGDLTTFINDSALSKVKSHECQKESETKRKPASIQLTNSDFKEIEKSLKSGVVNVDSRSCQAIVFKYAFLIYESMEKSNSKIKRIDELYEQAFKRSFDEGGLKLSFSTKKELEKEGVSDFSDPNLDLFEYTKEFRQVERTKESIPYSLLNGGGGGNMFNGFSKFRDYQVNHDFTNVYSIRSRFFCEDKKVTNKLFDKSTGELSKLFSRMKEHKKELSKLERVSIPNSSIKNSVSEELNRLYREVERESDKTFIFIHSLTADLKNKNIKPDKKLQEEFLSEVEKLEFKTTKYNDVVKEHDAIGDFVSRFSDNYDSLSYADATFLLNHTPDFYNRKKGRALILKVIGKSQASK